MNIALYRLCELAKVVLVEVGTVLAGRGFNIQVGHAGEFTAPQALDLLSKEDYTLIDVRSEKDKAKAGVPSLPRNAKNKFLPVP